MYQLLRDQFPGKRIVIAEFGWPSAGYNLRNAEPGTVRAGLGAAQFRHPRRSHRHGLQHRRGDRSALEILRRRRRTLLGHSRRVPRTEIRLDRPDRERELLEAGGDRAAGRHPDVAADPAARAADHHAGAGAFGGRQRRRRLGCHRVRLLGRALFRVRLGVRADARPDPAGAAGPDRDGAHRRNRRRRLRPRPAPADHQERAAGARHHRRERRLPEGLDPHPRLFRAGRDAEADARCGVAARLSEFRMRLHHQQHARSGVLAADPGSLPHARRALQVHQRREGPGLQGRRAAHRHGAHRRRRRDHRHHRRRLCRASGLAEGSGAGVRRSARRPGAGAAGASRRRPAR